MTSKSDLKKHIRARQAKTGESYTAARAHTLRQRDASELTAKPQKRTAVVLRCNAKSLTIRFLDEDEHVILRTSTYNANLRIVPAQFIELTLSKRWTFGGKAYVTGSIDRDWIDVPALGLEPLALTGGDIYDLERVFEPYLPPDPYADMWAFFASTPRPNFEFDGIAWGVGVGVDPDDHDACLVSSGSELRQHDRAGARALYMQAVMADPRCIDAHAHLGSLMFDVDPKYALPHYRIAVAIGELSLGADFGGMLMWNQIYNRPFLRALHGLGLSLWRIGEVQEAGDIFARILALNPPDNQGARFCWNDLESGQPWSPDL